MKKESLFISGSSGTERQKFVKNYIDELLNDKDDKHIIIYDATYSLITYNQYDEVSYYSVDTVQSYLKELTSLNSSKLTYIIADAYAGLMHQREVINLFLNFLKNKEYNINVILSARHKEFVPNELLPFFDREIVLEEQNTPLANLRN